MNRWLGIFAILLALNCSVFARASDAFVRANEAYSAGDFQQAIELYDSIVQQGQFSATVFYNLGNAWYRAGDHGKAILHYQRALALEPAHPEAQANLRLVRDKARALELRPNRVERAVERGTTKQYTVAAAAGFWIGAFALAALLLARRRSAALASGAVLGVLMLLAAGYAAYLREKSGSSLAVVIAKKTEARLATADSAGTVLALPPGSEIRLLSTRGDWTYAALPNDLRGWIPAANAERVRL